jgi:hypothetical protein
MARDVLRFHVGRIDDPSRRVAQARTLMELIVAADREPALAGYLRRLLDRPDWLVFHDELADVNTPVYFHEFAAHARRHGLQFLAEAHLADSHVTGLPAEVAQGLMALPDDVLVREQYLDFVLNRMFRQTLLCHDSMPIRRTLRPSDAARLWVSSPAHPPDGADLDGPGSVSFALDGEGAVETSDPSFKRVLARLGAAWPGALRLSELAGDRLQRLGEALLQAHAERIVDLHVTPPSVVPAPGERPRASALARRQAAAGRPLITTLRHDEVRLDDDLARELLPLLDGSRDRTALLAALDPPGGAEALDAVLDRLAQLALLVA